MERPKLCLDLVEYNNHYIYIILGGLLSVMVREFLKTSGVNLIQFCLHKVHIEYDD